MSNGFYSDQSGEYLNSDQSGEYLSPVASRRRWGLGGIGRSQPNCPVAARAGRGASAATLPRAPWPPPEVGQGRDQCLVHLLRRQAMPELIRELFDDAVSQRIGEHQHMQVASIVRLDVGGPVLLQPSHNLIAGKGQMLA